MSAARRPGGPAGDGAAGQGEAFAGEFGACSGLYVWSAAVEFGEPGLEVGVDTDRFIGVGCGRVGVVPPGAGFGEAGGGAGCCVGGYGQEGGHDGCCRPAAVDHGESDRDGQALGRPTVPAVALTLRG